MQNREQNLHVAVCSAVQLMNQSLLESPELQQAHVVLRQALVDHADVVRADTLSQPNQKCLCGLDTNPATSPRMDIFCPKHDASQPNQQAALAAAREIMPYVRPATDTRVAFPNETDIAAIISKHSRGEQK
jgi:hypothetical protein